MNIINEVKKVFKNSISSPFFEDECRSEHSFIKYANNEVTNHYGWELKWGMTKCVLVPLGSDKGDYVYKLPFNGFVLGEDNDLNDNEPAPFFPFEGAYHSIEKVRELTQHELDHFDNYCEAEVSIYDAAARNELSSFFLPIEMVDEVEGVPLYRQPKVLPSSYGYHECKVESKNAAKAALGHNIIDSSLLAELYDDYGVNSKVIMELIEFLKKYDITDLDSFNYGRAVFGDHRLKLMDYAGFHS